MFEHLFAPIKIRDMELKNRIILPAMGTRMAAENGAVTDKLIAYHAARAKGGCALNIVEVAAVHTPSAPAHFVSISEDYLIEGHKTAGKQEFSFGRDLLPHAWIRRRRCWLFRI